MKAPWHFWVLAILGLIWFSGGAYDYVMTAYENEDYLSILTPEQRAWMDARPTWFTAAWAVSIWTAVLGAVLMLFRKSAAGMMFFVSLLAYIPCTLWSYGMAQPGAFEVTGTIGVAFSAIIALTLIFFITYCGNMARRGVLR